MRKLVLLVLLVTPVFAACPPSCPDGTQLKLDVGKNTIVVTNTGSQGGSQTITLESHAGEIAKVRFYMGGTYTYVAPGGDIACHDPCTYAINMQYGRVSYVQLVRDSGDTTTLRTGGRYYLKFIPIPALTSFPTPDDIHGFKDYTKYYQFNIPAGADVSGGLRVAVRAHNLRPNNAAIVTNNGTEHVFSNFHLTSLVSNGTTCTGTTRIPYDSSIIVGAKIQINGMSNTLGVTGTNNASVLNDYWTVASTPTATTFTFLCPVAANYTYTGVTSSNNGVIQGVENSGTVSATTFCSDEMRFFGCIDGVHQTIRLMIPVVNSEFTVNATNTIGLRFKDQLDVSLYGLSHGFRAEVELVNGPDLIVDSVVVSGNTATAHTTTNIPASWTTGDTVLNQDFSGPQWRFNDKRVITVVDSRHYSFTIGPSVDNWGESGDTVGVSPFLTTAGTYTPPVTQDSTTQTAPTFRVAHCLIPKSAYTGPSLASMGGNASNGHSVFTGTVLKDPNSAIPNNQSLGTCQTSRCHTQTELTISDLNTFGFSEYTDVVAGMRRGLSESDAKDLAAYLSSTSVPRFNRGRPYNPPFQPMPGIDSTPVNQWSGGGGEQWRLTYDQDIFEWLAPGGTPATGDDYTGGSYTNWGITANINLHEIPIQMALPHWMQWLPRISPLDLYTDFLGGQDFTIIDFDTNYQTWLNTFVPVTLTAPMSLGATTMLVSNGSKIANNDYLQVDTDYCKVSSGGGTTTLTVACGATPCTHCSATTNTTHTSGTFVSNFTKFINTSPIGMDNNVALLQEFKPTYAPEFDHTGGRTNAGYTWPGQRGNQLFDMYSWVVSRSWELTQSFWLQNMLNMFYPSTYGITLNARAATPYSRGLYTQITFDWGPHKSQGGTHYFMNAMQYSEDNWGHFTAMAYHLSPILDAGSRYKNGNGQQDDQYYYIFNLGLGLHRPASNMFFIGNAWEFNNSNGFAALNGNPGGAVPTINFLRLNFPLGYTQYGGDLFQSETRKAEIINVIANNTLALLNTYTVGDWQTFFGSTDLNHTPSRSAAQNGASTFFSDSFAYGQCIFNYYGVSGATTTAIGTKLNSIFTSGHDYTTDASATATRSGTPPGNEMSLMNFFMFSKCGEGAGLMKKLQEEGNTCAISILEKDYSNVYDGILKKSDFPDEDAIMIFDSSGMGARADSLRAAGYKVFGASKFHDKLENDREFGLQFMEDHGILIPETKDFTKFSDGIKFVKDNKKKRYVFKPSGKGLPCKLTYSSSDAEDLIHYMNYVEKNFSSQIEEFILQEFIEGAIVSSEYWVGKYGFIEPLNHTIEVKKFMNDDIGPSTGCSGNIVWKGEDAEIGEHLRAIEEELIQEGYIGPIDINCIISKDGNPYGLEWTPRFGLDAMPTFLHLLGQDIGKLISDSFNDVNEMELLDCFAGGVRITIPPYPIEYKEKFEKDLQKISPNVGIPIRGFESCESNCYFYEVMKENDLLVHSSGPGVIACISDIAMTPESCFDLPYDVLDECKVPDKQYRTDLDKILPRMYKEVKEVMENVYS